MEGNMEKTGILKYLDCSTGHLQESTRQWLESVAGSNEIGQTVASYEYGAFVSVPPDTNYHDDVPSDLREVLDFARAEYCTIVRFDADGDQHGALPFYD